MNIWKVNKFEVEEYISRWSENLSNLRSPTYLKDKMDGGYFPFLNELGYFTLSQIVFKFGVWAFIHYSKYKLFHLQKSLYAGVHLLQFLNALTCSPITIFFKCIKLHQILSLFSTINLAYALEINIYGRYYSNLSNLFQRY